MLADQSRDNFKTRPFPWFQMLCATCVAIVCSVVSADWEAHREHQSILDKIEQVENENLFLKAELGSKAFSHMELEAANSRLTECQNKANEQARLKKIESQHCFNLGSSEENVIAALGPPVSAYFDPSNFDEDGKRVRVFVYPDNGSIILGKHGAFSYVNMGHLICK